MTTDIQVSEQTHQYFVQEATELLQTMDDELQNLREGFSVQKVHNLMRAAHTLKGASASVGLDAVKKTTHSLEDVFKALCHQDTVISIEMEGLIFQGYDCLKLLMSSQLAGAKVDEADILDRMATVVTRLQEMLGDRFGQGGHLPTSSELGFDMTQSIFEVGVAQRIEALEEALVNPEEEELAALLETQSEVFIGLAESLDLPGFGEIASLVLQALEQSPEKALDLAKIALDNYKSAQAEVLAGDREKGGTPSADLLQIAGKSAAQLSQVVARQDNAGSQNSHVSTVDSKEPARQKSQLTQQQNVSAKTTSWFVRLWKILVKPIGTADSVRSAHSVPTIKQKKQSKGNPLGEALSLSPKPNYEGTFTAPNGFIDYSVEEEEPVDLALSDLIPTGLSSIDLPLAQSASQSTESQIVGDNHSFIKIDTDEDSDLSGLVPAELSTLSRTSQNVEAQSAQLDLSAIANKDGSRSDYDSAPLGIEQPLQPLIELPIVPTRTQHNSATIRMTVEHLDQLSQAMGELLTYQNRQALYNEQLALLVKTLLERISRQQKQLNKQRGQSKVGHASQSQPNAPLSDSTKLTDLAYSRFDSLELDQYSDVQLLAQSFLEETVQQSENAEAIELFVTRSGQELEKQKRLLANTRETLLEARMLPLEKIFQRFPAALERLQSQHNKLVKLELQGSDVLVDKVIADKLYDPLLHLVRNAFDHGIESPESRQAQNKSTTGTITIEAIQQGRHLVINVKDDGKGLDLEMIRRKAVDNQVVTTAEAAALTSDQTIDLLFEAGFSTAGEVDDLSGRGVGLDAVKAQVRSLQGWVTVSHEIGAGTCFSLQIPSSLTIAKLLLCQAKGRVYALIADAIEHILIPSPQQVRSWTGGKTLTWQANDEEYLVPVNALADVLHYASPMPSHRLGETHGDIKASACDPVILLNRQNALVGIEVDQLLGEQELVISSLGETIVPPPYLYGSSILPDGQLTLVLDGVMLAKIASEQRNKGGAESMADNSGPTRIKPAEHEPVFVKKLVLTVDDSITVRNSLAEALQKADYQVIQARDGSEALQQLQRYPGVEAILCDIEMPGMNGFEFLKVRQQTPKIAAIPTIMLTSRAGAKHRLLTKELGATTYLTKPYLTPQLLKTVAEAIETHTTKQLSAAGDPHA